MSLILAWFLMPDEYLINSRDFPAQTSLGFTDNDPKKRKFPVKGSSLDDNPLLMPEDRGEWTDCFELIGRQQ